MKHYGTVESFDTTKGTGQIKQEKGDTALPFERSAMNWDGKAPPEVGKRLSYEVSEKDGVSSAINLQKA